MGPAIKERLEFSNLNIMPLARLEKGYNPALSQSEQNGRRFIWNRGWRSFPLELYIAWAKG